MTDDSSRILPKDIEAARCLIAKNYADEIVEGGNVTPKMAELVYDHAIRVSEWARAIAIGEKLDPLTLEFAGLLHDVARLGHDLLGGIKIFASEESAGHAMGFLEETLGKDKSLAKKIADMIESHAWNPIMVKMFPHMIDQPGNPEEWALRDAKLLDQIDWPGIALSTEIRQRPQIGFFKTDKGSILNAVRAVMIQRQKYIFEVTEAKSASITVKKIAPVVIKRGDQFFKFYKSRRVDNLGDFHKLTDDFGRETLGEDFWEKTKSLTGHIAPQPPSKPA